MDRPLDIAFHNTDPSEAVEAAIRRHVDKLAARFEPPDRFYLEALGIAAGAEPGRRQAMLRGFRRRFPVWNDQVAFLAWELQPEDMLEALVDRVNAARTVRSPRKRGYDFQTCSTLITARPRSRGSRA